MNDPLLYTIAVVTLLAVPGPTNTLLALAGTSDGPKRALLLLGAEVLAYVISISIVGIVVAPAIADIAWLTIAVRLAVAVYLVWLAVSLWRRVAAAQGGAEVTGASVFITTLLNPKAFALALGIVPWSHPAIGWYLAGLVAAIVATGGLWLAGGVALAAAAGGHARIVPRIASVALAGFAGLLVLSVFG